jgi:hypothetical protein
MKTIITAALLSITCVSLKAQKAIVYSLWGLFIYSVSFVSCTSKENEFKKTVHLAALEKFEHDSISGYILLEVLKAYPKKLACSNSEVYYNLYISKLKDGQVVYVFEPCKESVHLLADTANGQIPMIDTNDISKNEIDSVVIFVPLDFSIPAGSKYVLTPLTWLKES